MAVFSQELITKTQNYFLRKWRKELSTEEAESYLHALGGLFLAFAPEAEGSQRATALRAVPAAPPDLISTLTYQDSSKCPTHG